MFEQLPEFNKQGSEVPPEDKEAALDAFLKAMESDQISLKILLKYKEAELRVKKKMWSEDPNSVDPEEIQELEKTIKDFTLRTRGDA